MKDAIKKILQDPYSLSLSSLFLFIACWFYPVNSFLSRCTLICIFLFFWFSPYIAGVRNLKFIFAHLLLTIFVIASPFIFIHKSKPFETNELYLKNLHSFAGTPYYWGGENLIGIDCSGLPRKSMMNACFYTGLFSKAAELWWYDSSARALSEHYRNYTEKVASFSSLRQVDYSLLKAGDMAVTSDGIHVIVYLGNERWIQADPNQGRVVIENPKVTKSSWFDLKVNVVRWSIF